MSVYLERYAWKKQYLKQTPNRDTGIIIVIPAYNEPAILPTLESLTQTTPPPCDVEVLIVVNKGINDSTDIGKKNSQLIQKVRNFINDTESHPKILLINEQSLPEKHAGVGLARKIGMDEAVRRFIAVNNDGIIVNLDADCTVEQNYLKSIYAHFNKNPGLNGCSIYFEHPITGPLDPEIYTGIINYELHIRYYIQGLRFAGYPFAYHTLGSSMAVRSSAYQRQGGMNKRKAAEDFHFLHKVMQTGQYSDLLKTTVFPSPRPSNRVPFGTGKAIYDWLQMEKKEFLSYNPQAFIDLNEFIRLIPVLNGKNSLEINSILNSLSASIREFLINQNFLQIVAEANKHSSEISSFVKRFYRWFNGLKVLQYFHFSRDNFHPHIKISEGASWLLKERRNHFKLPYHLHELLKELRKVEKNDVYRISNNELTPR